MTDINNLQVGSMIDWKFGVCTRTIERIEDDKFIINDFSSGWSQSTVDKKTLDELISGTKSLLDLNWE